MIPVICPLSFHFNMLCYGLCVVTAIAMTKRQLYANRKMFNNRHGVMRLGGRPDYGSKHIMVVMLYNDTESFAPK